MIRNSKNKMDSPKYSYPNPLKGYKNKTSQNALMQIHKKYSALRNKNFSQKCLIE